ncbi:MAG: amidase family protein, partial [Actinomycetota bacterium]|nr:amidase family protein [Actinomycetota bacterium]
ALQGIVGIKPTYGVVPTDGVVPACRSYDCVTVFARDLDTADAAMAVMAGGARAFPADAPLSAPESPTVAVPQDVSALPASWQAAFRTACARLEGHGAVLRTIDLAPFLAAARLLYDGGLVAERYDAVGEFVEGHRKDVDPTVGAIISAAGTISAAQLLRDRRTLADLTGQAMAALEGCAALLLPTTTDHPTIADVAADPVGVNSRLGTYTNFCNLMDMCAVAVPAGTAGDDQFGVSVLAIAGADAVAIDVARLVTSPARSVALTGAASLAGRSIQLPWPLRVGAESTALLVVGAHLRGQPLAFQLEQRGARWAGPAVTAPLYRLARLDTTPPKPGLVRVGAAEGSAIGGELWLLSTAMLGDFLAMLPEPMSLGRVTLADGTEVVGFGCALDAWRDGEDITHHGDWPTYLSSVALGSTRV